VSDLDFKPESEGLGFHPFSNGLPYSPVPSKSLISTPNLGRAPAAAAPSILPREVLWNKETPAPVQAPAQAKHHPLYRTRRVAAFVVDLVVSAVAVFGIFGTGAILTGLNIDVFDSRDALFATAAFFLMFHWLWSTIQEVALKATFGKNLLGLSLDGGTGAILLRAVMFVPSLALGGIGILFSLLDREGRCWHDGVSGLNVSEKQN
jgi:hypothetical protein